jgi:hypothetical protein
MSLGNISVNQYWNPVTNVPKLVSGKGTHGQGYVISTAGSTTLDGVSNWQANDIVVFVLDQWIRLSGSFGGGGGVVTGAAPDATRTVMNTLNFTTPPDTIRTNGWNAPGDGGHAFYKKVNSIPANFPASGTITPLDGSLYIMVPDRGEVWADAFGIQSSVYNDDSHAAANWQAMEDAKYVILLNSVVGIAGGSGGGIKLRVGRGLFWMNKPHSIEGGAYEIEGQGQNDDNGGTFFRVPNGSDGFQIQHAYAGDNQTFGHEGYPLNGNPTTVGMLVYVSGQTHVYKCNNTGTPNMSSPPTGTGTGIISGTASFDYVRERTWAESRGHGSTFSAIRKIIVWGGWTGKTDPYGFDEDLTQVDGAYHSAVVMRTRCTVEDFYCLSFAGHGIAITADGDTEIRGAGNANGWVLRRIRAYSCGHDGIHVGLSDSNAGMGQDIDTAYNGRSGVGDWCFLGNRWANIQDAFSGNHNFPSGRWPKGVVYGGYYYIARAPQLGADAHVVDYHATPGTDAVSWIRAGGDGTVTPSSDYPAWSNTGDYAAVGAMVTNNTNAENQIFGLYCEGGGCPPQLGGQDLAIGTALGDGAEVTRGAQIYSHGKWLRTLMVSNQFAFPSGIQTMISGLGSFNKDGGDPAQAPENTVWWWTNYGSTTYRAKLQGATALDTTHLDLVFRRDGAANAAAAWTALDTSLTFGRGTTQPDVWVFPKLAIGDGGGHDSTACTIFMTTQSHLGTGATASSPARDGEIVFYVNSAKTISDPVGWQAIAGFWHPFYP